MLEDIAHSQAARPYEISASAREREDGDSAGQEITIDKDNTTIIEGAASPAKSKDASGRSARGRGNHLGLDKEKVQERLAKLVGGVAVIKVGAATKPS